MTTEEAVASPQDGEPRPCVFPACVSTDRHFHGGFPGGYENPADPDGPPIEFTTEPAPGVRDYNGALLTPVEDGEQNPQTPTGKRILLQDFRGNEAYTITRREILAIEAEAVAAFVWERLEATPGFNEHMAAALADVKAGRVYRWEDVKRRLDEEGYEPPAIEAEAGATPPPAQPDEMRQRHAFKDGLLRDWDTCPDEDHAADLHALLGVGGAAQGLPSVDLDAVRAEGAIEALNLMQQASHRQFRELGGNGEWLNRIYEQQREIWAARLSDKDTTQ